MSFAEKIHSILCTNSVYDKDLKNMQSTRSDASNEEQNETDSTLPKLKGDNSIEEERNSKTKERIAMQSNVLEHLINFIKKVKTLQKNKISIYMLAIETDLAIFV